MSKLFTLVDKKDVHLAPEKKVIPAKQYSQLIDGATLLKLSKEESLNFREDVAKECETLKEQAELAGFEAGLVNWNEQLKLLEKEKDDVRREMEESIVPLALTAVKKIIGKELEAKPDTIIDIISTALKGVSQHKKIAIYVNHADLELVEKSRPQIKKLFEHLESLSISTRPDVALGGCIIETEAGIINAQLESQLKALEAAFITFFQAQKGKKRTA